MQIAPGSVPPRQHMRPIADETPRAWRGETGARYAARNPQTVEAIDESYRTRFGETRTSMSARYIGHLPRDARILEVGCSKGVMLDVLAGMGFHRLFGVDLCQGALVGCRWPRAVSDGAVLPFADGAFDVVFTSGTLMHVPPADRMVFCREVLRVCKRWVWGFEIWSERGQVWKFQGIVPTAWALNEPESYVRAGGVRLLKAETWGLQTTMAHKMFLLEKTR